MRFFGEPRPQGVQPPPRSRRTTAEVLLHFSAIPTTDERPSLQTPPGPPALDCYSPPTLHRPHPPPPPQPPPCTTVHLLLPHGSAPRQPAASRHHCPHPPSGQASACRVWHRTAALALASPLLSHAQALTMPRALHALPSS